MSHLTSRKAIVVLGLGASAALLLLSKFQARKKRRQLDHEEIDENHQQPFTFTPQPEFTHFLSVGTWLLRQPNTLQMETFLPRLLDDTRDGKRNTFEMADKMSGDRTSKSVDKHPRTQLQTWPTDEHPCVYDSQSVDLKPPSLSLCNGVAQPVDKAVFFEVDLGCNTKLDGDSKTSFSRPISFLDIASNSVTERVRGPKASCRAAIDNSIEARRAILADKRLLNAILVQLLRLRSKKALIVTDFSLLRAGALTRLTDALDRYCINFVFFCGCRPSEACRDLEECNCLTCHHVEIGAGAAGSHCCDVIVSVGGGSAEECAKAIVSKFASSKHRTKLESKPIPLVSIPFHTI